MANDKFSDECKDVLGLLASAKNVLISGPPGTGKSRLLSEVALAFELGLGTSNPSFRPAHNPSSAIPIPSGAAAAGLSPLSAVIPSASRTNRKVFRTAFHQNSKYRDFVTGVAPRLSSTAEVSQGFCVIEGILYRACEHAKAPGGVSLLIIDEINRGPAVQVFGGALVAMEADKRLAPDGSKTSETQWFEILNPQDGKIIEYALSDHLYIVAAQNQADTSVEPLDVAFLRRWEPYKLDPNAHTLRKHFGLGSYGTAPLPETPATSLDVLEASVRAWESVNRRIALGRGPEFRIGHGVLMSGPPPSTTENALDQMARRWAKVIAHVEEVFFGDLRGVAATLNAITPPPFHTFKLDEKEFADDLRFELLAPSRLGSGEIYATLRAIAG